MDFKDPLLGEWPDDGIKPPTDSRGKHKSPRKLDWKYIAAVAFLLLPIAWLCRHFAEFVLVISRERPVKHGESQLHQSQHSLGLDDEFEKITPSEKLQWHGCYNEEFLCARLTVPMDYNRPLGSCKSHPSVHIAVIMLPAAKSRTSGKYTTSPLLLNPGGPGGSGVSLVAVAGSSLQDVLPEYDLVSFDPRGIGSTTPQADCFAFPSAGNDEKLSSEDYARAGFNRFNFLMAGQSIGLVNTSDDSLAKIDTRARMIGKLCETNDARHGNDSILRHLSTPAVAQDMLSIVDAWDAWREDTGQTSEELQGSDFENTGHKEDGVNPSTKGKLVYWGFSYGTLLGATFASMFPDRVGRVLLDGVVDADFYVERIWGDSLRDADKVQESFFKYCHESRERCALHREGDSEEDLKARFYSILNDLKQKPITGVSGVSNAPAIFTFTDMKAILFMSLYSPSAIFPVVASLFDIIYRGWADMILDALGPSVDFKSFCSARLFVPGGEAQAAIMCSDKRYPLNETVPELQARFERISNVSQFADVWTTLMTGCDGWGIKATDPPMRWDRHPAHKQKSINTSFPLMFISNTADPVTPLFAGVKMARKFVGAGLIEQKSEGHCSISAPSICTLNKIVGYFSRGEVPPIPKWGPDGGLEGGDWETCEANEHPFQLAWDNLSQGLIEDKDVKLLKAWKTVGEKTIFMNWFGQPLSLDMMKLMDVMVHWGGLPRP